MLFFRLILRNLTAHKLRSFLTIGSLVVAILLLCVLRSLVTTLQAGAAAASVDRLWVQSAVSLFVDLPLSYQAKIAGVEGVEKTCKWQWFGGYYQDQANFFAQFAVDQKEFLEMYADEIEIVDGDVEVFLGNRTSCLVGTAIASQFGWKPGDKIPITGALFPHPEGANVAWEFVLGATYRPLKPSLDDRTLFFHWDYFEKTLENSETGPPGVGTLAMETAPGVDQTAVMATVDQLFENGPQRVQTTTEAEFNAQFVSMFGNVPFFVSSIGGAVLLAILLACVNTMLMAAREQTHDVGILKALGFQDSRMSFLLGAQSFVLCGVGGALGIGGALLMEPAVAKALGTMFPGYRITQETLLYAVLVTVLISVLAGLVPAWRANRLKCVEAMGATK